ncbi:MAG: SIMPL domain-containing protein [Burkholderiaceae bacterium]|nr:SIMPL domain-containing protein [Burkholderiaceae bacterium]
MAAKAQTGGAAGALPEAPRNVLKLSASGRVEAQQDLLRVTLSTVRDGTDVAVVQKELSTALDAALAIIKPSAQKGQLDVRTGNFSVNPSYNKNGKITGWQGSTELVLEGRDFARITTAAARAQSLSIANITFDLSPERRAQVESQARAQAIDRFKDKAAEIAKAFGFANYSLREVTISSDENATVPRMFANKAAMSMKSVLGEPPSVQVEPGNATVTVTATGSVQAR